MNAHLNLDDLKQRWAEQDPLLQRSLHLNIALLRENLASKASASLIPQKRVKWFELVCHLAMILWLSRFALQHLADPRYAVSALLLDLFYIGVVVLDVHHRRLIDRVDFSAPVGVVQQRIEALRALRLRRAKWIFLIAPLLWVPFQAILIKSLFNVDFYAEVVLTYWIANFAVALAWIPLIMLVAQCCVHRFAHAPRLQRLLDGIAGSEFARLRHFSTLLAELDTPPGSGLPPALRTALSKHARLVDWSSADRADALHTIAQNQSRRLLAGILLLAASLLGTGSLMALPGGTASIVAPALILHLGVVACMVMLIRQRARVAALDFDADRPSVRRQLIGCMNARVQLARMVLMLLPAFGLAGLLLTSALRIDASVGTVLSAIEWAAYGLAMLVSCAFAYWLAPHVVPAAGSAGGGASWIHGKHWQAALSRLDALKTD